MTDETVKLGPTKNPHWRGRNNAFFSKMRGGAAVPVGKYRVTCELFDKQYDGIVEVTDLGWASPDLVAAMDFYLKFTSADLLPGFAPFEAALRIEGAYLMRRDPKTIVLSVNEVY